MSCRSSRIKVPTVNYTVRPSDTVFSIAAQFNITPAEVSALNRLSHSSELFPEQVIRVPDIHALAELEKQRKAEREEEEARERERQSANCLATSPRAGPGIAARVTPSPSAGGSSHASFSADDFELPPLTAEESVRERQFVKSEHARLFTDGEGCVSGTLIITPQTLMFDPSVQDRLVQERGQSYFQWQIDLRQVRTVAVYSDPRAMRLMVGDLAKIDDPNLDEAELRMELNEVDNRFVLSAEKSEAESTVAASPEAKTEAKEAKEEKEEKEVKESEDVREDEKAEGEEEAEATKEVSPAEEEGPTRKEMEGVEAKEEKAECPDVEEQATTDDEKQEGKRTENVDENAGTAEESAVEEKAIEEETAVEGSANCDTAATSFEARPPLPNNSQLDYLCILYKPTPPHRQFASSSTSSTANAAVAAAAAATGAKQPRLPDRGQHWFTLPHEKSRELLAFLKDSMPEEPDSSGATAGVAVPSASGNAPASGSERYFVLQENHFAMTPPQGESDRTRQLRTIRQESLDWELINRDEVLGERGLAAAPSIDEEMLIPALIGEAKILQDWMLKDIVANLPSRAEGCLTMELAYSTHVHGFSLHSLYRKCKREEGDKPCVLLIRSQKCPTDGCFGAVLASGIRVSDHFYGTGETYLMRWTPQFEKFPWSGNNNYIIRCGNKSMMIGSSNGAVALFIDEGLYRGRSQVCDTFVLPCPLTHNGEEDFIIENLEVWNFK